MKVLQNLVWVFPMVIPICLSMFPCEEMEVGECLKKVQSETVTANTQFALKLFKHMASKSSPAGGSPPQNILFSPLSVSTALSMLVLGAQSTTRQEILDILSRNHTQGPDEVHKAAAHLLKTLDQPKGLLWAKIGNAIFLDKDMKLLEGFVNGTDHYYQAEVRKTDFTRPQEVKRGINDHMKNKTDGKIPEFIKDLEDDTVMVLINYFLFTGEWKDRFGPLFTVPDAFFVDQDTTVTVPMMANVGVYGIYYDKERSCRVIELKYKSFASLLLIVPERGKIHDVEDALSLDIITGWRKSLGKRNVRLQLPKFSVTSSVNLKKVLSDLGMTMAFSNGADFSGISPDTKLRVSKAIHKVLLNVGERGTEVTASTGFGLTHLSTIPDEKVDRPFIVLVFDDNTDSVLLMGRIRNPAEKTVEL